MAGNTPQRGGRFRRLFNPLFARRVAIWMVAVSAGLPLFARLEVARAGTLVSFNFNVDGINHDSSVMVDLFDDLTPATVANFLNYVNAGEYQNTIIHRVVPGFVVQGGGYGIPANLNDTTPFPHIATTFPSPVNEFHRTNTRGTISMAKMGAGPTVPDPVNSATSEWFFNLADNSSNLDNQNGGFTAFGWVVGKGTTNVVDQIAADPTFYYKNFDDHTQAASFPLQNFTAQPVLQSNLVVLESITIVGTHAAFLNPVLAADVNNDGEVHPNDANTIITDLLDNNNQSHPVNGPFSGTSYLDVNGDGNINASDAHLVINALLDQSQAQSQAALSMTSPMSLPLAMSAVPEPSACVLAATGFLTLGGYLLRRRRRAANLG